VAAAAAGGQHSIGLRCPAHPVALALLTACGTGLAGPSANRCGRVSPTPALHVQEELGEDLLVLDGGPCAVGIESTIVDCTRGQPVLLRPGVLTCAQLEAACGQPVLDKDTPVKTSVKTQAPRASGTLESHYAPNARVRLMDAKGLQTGLDTLDSKAKDPAARTGTVAVYARSPLRMNTNILHKRMPEDAALAAQQLFAVLRELDASAVSEIWVQIPPDTPEWDGVRDRLNRAAADGSPPTRG
jgi:L-threonylcarbamoyladenylate synthase